MPVFFLIIKDSGSLEPELILEPARKRMFTFMFTGASKSVIISRFFTLNASDNFSWYREGTADTPCKTGIPVSGSPRCPFPKQRSEGAFTKTNYCKTERELL